MDMEKLNKDFLKTLTLLYVEDDDEIFSQMKSILPRFCATLLTARNGKEGMEVFASHAPDIIITDVHMPVLDGLSMAEQIRTVNRSVPIILVTAFERTDYLVRAIEAKIDSYVPKPLRIDRLVEGLTSCAQRLRIEQKRQDREDDFLQIFQGSADAHVLLRDGLITDCNRAALLMLRCDKQEIAGQNIEAFFPELQPDGRRTAEIFSQMVRDISRAASTTCDIVLERPDGGHFWADTSLSSITLQRKQLLLWNMRDISARKEAESKLTSITDSTSDAILMIDAHRNIIFWNPAATTLFGYSHQEAIGRNLHELLAPTRYHAAHHAAFEKFQKTGEGASLNTTVETTALRQGGDEFPIELSLSAHRQGVEWQAIGIIRDITERKKAEAALADRERFMRKLIDILPGMVGYWDAELRCGFANRAYQEWFGKSPEEMKGIHIRALMGEELYARNEPYITAARGGEYQHFERTLIKSDGNAGYTWCHYIPDCTPDSVNGFFVLITDVTDLKKAEETVSRQDAFYKATLDGLTAHICVINEQGTIVTTNQAWDRFGNENDGIPVHCGVGSNYFFACQPPVGEQEPSATDFATGIFSVLKGTLPEYIVEYPCHTPTRDIWFVCKVNRFSINDDIYAVVSHEDITWRKSTEKQLRLLSRVVDQSPVMVIITNTEGTIEFVNNHFVTSSGYSAEEALGQNPRILKSEFTPPETFSELWATIRCGNVWEGEFVNLRKNGEVSYEQVKISPLRDEEGVITHYLGVKENINKRKGLESSLVKAKEKAEIANLAKDEFLAVMSHEMRTPLNGVLGMTDLLLDSELTDEQREFVTIIGQSGKNLLRIIRDILDFTLVRVNKLNIDTSFFHLQNVLDDTTATFASRATEAGLALTAHIVPEVPRQLKGDVGKIQQILTGLLDNALKFTSKGGAVGITVSCPAMEAGSAVVRFDVHDTGSGIAEFRLKDIFSAFSQIDSSATRTHGGTGLGLALAKELAELLGGEVGVTSQLGNGSTFWFTARVELLRHERTPEGGGTPREADSTLPAEEVAELCEVAPEVRTPRILLAEDNAINQKIICNLLKNIGYTADVVGDGLKAVQALELGEYDLVLMDCMMPVMNGYEATTTIRDHSSLVRNHQVPIIAVTANALEGDREKCLECGMDDYLAKPLNKSALAEMLEKWFTSPSPE